MIRTGRSGLHDCDAVATGIRFLNSVRLQILQIGQESSDRTKNMVRAVEESKMMGRETLTELDRQVSESRSRCQPSVRRVLFSD